MAWWLETPNHQQEWYWIVLAEFFFFITRRIKFIHENDVLMSAMASRITSLTIVYSTIYSGTDQWKHQSAASLASVWEIHLWPVNSPHKGPLSGKCFHLMTSHDMPNCCINIAILGTSTKTRTMQQLNCQDHFHGSPPCDAGFRLKSKPDWHWLEEEIKNIMSGALLPI